MQNRRGGRGRLVVVVLGCLSACGGSSGPDVGDQHPELVQTFGVAPGTCGVSRSIDLLQGDLVIDTIIRGPTGFVATGTQATTGAPAWLSLSLDGITQRTSFGDWSAPTIVLASFPFAASVSELHPLMLTSVGAQDAARLQAWPLDNPGTALDVGAHFARGTTVTAAASSRDGKQAVFAAQHPGDFPPHLVALDRHGLSSEQQVLPDGDVTCLRAASTADSFAVLVVYSSPAPLLTIIAPADAPGRASRELSLSTAAGCPLVQADRLLTVAAAVEDGVQIFVFASGDIVPVLPHPPLLSALGALPRWLRRHSGGGFSLLVDQQGHPRLVELAESDGTLAWVSANLPAGTVIPGAPGELFLDVLEPAQAGTSSRRRIVQVSCNGVGFAGE